MSREHRGHLVSQLEDAGYIVHRMPLQQSGSSVVGDGRNWLGATQPDDASDTLDALGSERLDWLVVDHYGIDAVWEKLVRPAAVRVMVIDDLANRPHDADLLLDQNYVGANGDHRYTGRVPECCRCMLGPRYALLQPIYRRVRQVLPAREGPVRRIMAFFGAQDPTRSIVTVLRALIQPEFGEIAIDAIPGSDPELLAVVRSIAHRHSNVTIHERLPSLAGLIARADLGIGASGATTWERACLGLPTVIATIADNQVEVANALAADGFALLLGPAAAISNETWQASLLDILRDGRRLTHMGRRAYGLTDGHGAGRVAHAMLGGHGSTIGVRAAEAMDEMLMLDWANDPAVRRFSFNKAYVTEDQHHSWFIARLADPTCTILIGEDTEGLPLGQVRFEAVPSRREATINVSVEPAVRGTGIGKKLLREAITVWRKRAPEFSLVAEVIPENDASKRLFLGAHFETTLPRRPHSVAFQLRPGAQVNTSES